MAHHSEHIGPIGIFDSGYGGLTVLKEIVKQLPQYKYLYLGDNARAPYGPLSYETVYEYTLQCVEWFFKQGCSLVILACNTASAKALRTIQQKDLPIIAPDKRVLGVIRPTTEVIGQFTWTNKVGIVGTTGTVQSGSYPIEIAKFFPEIKVYQEACPMWVSLVEKNEYKNESANYFIRRHIDNLLNQDSDIDTLLLGCTHYPLLIDKLRQFIPPHITIVTQGEIIAKSLEDYLKRHPAIEGKCLHTGGIDYYTTDDSADFNTKATLFWGEEVESKHVTITERERKK